MEKYNFFKDVFMKVWENKLAVVSFFVIILIIFSAIFASILSPHNPNHQNLKNILGEPSKDNLLGTDEFGRDILSRLLYGARVSLGVGILAETISVIIGTLMGAIAGYFGGWVDSVISRTIEIFASFPQILFAIAIMFVLGTGVINVFIAIGFVGWTGLARIIRSEVIKLKNEKYIEACKISGGSHFRIIFKHILPNILSTIIVVATMNLPGNIMYEASLSFLGLGVQPPTASWGSMINSAKSYIRTNPTYSIFPGLAIMITVLAFNIFGDALRDALDPKIGRE